MNKRNPKDGKRILKYWIGIDTGGTFTDCVIMDKEGILYTNKAASTPNDLSIGVLNSIEATAESMNMKLEDVLKYAVTVAHASTTGINIFLTRTGAKLALLTTQGFEDTLLVMRAKGRHAGLSEEEIKRAVRGRKPEPIISKSLIKGVKERIDYKGEILVPLEHDSTKRTIRELVEKGVDAIAISLLWSTANPVHEIEIKKMINEMYPSIYVTLSSEVAPIVGEYERTSTAVMSGYIGPSLTEYHTRLEKSLQEKGFKYSPLIMQCYGGCVTLEELKTQPAGAIASGPAGGIIATKFLAELIGYNNVIATDVGGTSFDVGIITEGKTQFSREPVIGQFPVQIPMLDVRSIGAGGGSIAWIEPISGLLKVGPESAGAMPGPACYDIGGTEPTLTDADLVLGYLNPNYFLGGKIKLNRQKAIESIKKKIANPLNISVEEAASGMYDIATSKMGDLIRSLTVEKGYDPRDFVLFAYGGAGALHASRYGREAQKIIIPRMGAVHSAMGVLTSDFMHTYQLGSPRRIPVDTEWFNKIFEQLENRAIDVFITDGFKERDLDVQRFVDMRYALQLNELRTAVPKGKLSAVDLENVWDDFEKLYENQFGKGAGYRKAGMQVVNFIVEARAKILKPTLSRFPLHSNDASPALKLKRDIFLRRHRGFFNVDIYDGGKLNAGNVILGPAIIELPLTTILIEEDQVGKVDEYLNIILGRK